MAEANSSETRIRRPWALTFFSLLAIASLVAMPILAGNPGEVELPDIVRFLGHFHPMVLHLPIGVFLLILVQELGALCFKRGREEIQRSLFPLFFGAASAMAAVIAGFLLYHGHGGDYAGSDLAERHLWGGLLFTMAAVLTLVLKAWSLAGAVKPVWYRLMLVGSVGVMGFASHDGASLTHGSDYLTMYAPDPIRRMMGIKPKADDGDKAGTDAGAGIAADQMGVYPDIVAPILERRCVQCHKEGKSKGKYRMDTYDLLVKGGSEGPGLEAGNAEESNIIVRIDLPEDDDEHMPPEGKPDIEEAELIVLKWWIDEGADPVKKLGDFQLPAEVRDSMDKLSTIAAANPGGSAETGGDPAAEPASVDSTLPDEDLKARVAALAAEFPGAISFESQQSAAVTFTAASLRGNLDDASFAKLESVLPHLVSVDLSATRITDQSVAALAAAKQLRMIRLSETGVTDTSIDSLLKLPLLESINFYGTQVTDAGVLKLSGLPNLKRLYLWQTPVTAEGITAIKEKMPQLEVIVGN